MSSVKQRTVTKKQKNTFKVLKIYRGVEQLVARRAHNPKVTGSSPVPATLQIPEKCAISAFFMGSILEELKSVYKTVYKIERKPRKYSEVRVYHGGPGFDLSKRWYAYFEYLHPVTGKMTRQTPVVMNINRMFSTKKERLKHLYLLRDSLEKLLEDGYSPYGDGPEKETYTMASAVDFALALKKTEVGDKTYTDYKSRAGQFLAYLEGIGKGLVPCTEIDKRTVMGFLNKVSQESSNRNRNNTKVTLSAIFTTLEENGIIPANFVKHIKNLKVSGGRDRTYSLDQEKIILDHLRENDREMLLFVEFVCFFFFRPVEVVRLTIADINLEEGLVTDRTKTKGLKTKIIPAIIKRKLTDYLSLYPNACYDDFLFTPIGIGPWQTKETYRRDYWTKRYKKSKDSLSDRLKLGKGQYAIYSFRHTYITRAFRNLSKQGKSEDEAIALLSKITGHTSNAIRGYIHWVDASLPEDYSDLLV